MMITAARLLLSESNNERQYDKIKVEGDDRSSYRWHSRYQQTLTIEPPPSLFYYGGG